MGNAVATQDKLGLIKALASECVSDETLGRVVRELLDQVKTNAPTIIPQQSISTITPKKHSNRSAKATKSTPAAGQPLDQIRIEIHIPDHGRTTISIPSDIYGELIKRSDSEAAARMKIREIAKEIPLNVPSRSAWVQDQLLKFLDIKSPSPTSE